MRYNTPNNPMDNFRQMLYRGGIPVTTGLLLINAATFLLAFMLPALMIFLAKWAIFSTDDVRFHPWTIVTYPLVYLDASSNGFFNFLFGGFLLWSAGGSLERSWGSARYGVFFFVTGAISAIFLLLGSLLLGQPDILFGFFLPLACCVMAFCMLNPEQTISFFFFPIPAKFFAAIITLFTWVYVGQGGHALLGVFALAGILASFLYVRYGRAWADIGSYSAPRRTSRGPDLRMDSRPAARPTFRTTLDGSPRQRKPFDIAGRLRDWRDRRKLEKLWRNSGLSDSEPEWRDDEKRRR